MAAVVIGTAVQVGGMAAVVIGMAVQAAGMLVVVIGTVAVGMKAAAGIMVVTVAVGELDPR
jgi:hypothetical protein